MALLPNKYYWACEADRMRLWLYHREQLNLLRILLVCLCIQLRLFYSMLNSNFFIFNSDYWCSTQTDTAEIMKSNWKLDQVWGIIPAVNSTALASLHWYIRNEAKDRHIEMFKIMQAAGSSTKFKNGWHLVQYQQSKQYNQYTLLLPFLANVAFAKKMISCDVWLRTNSAFAFVAFRLVIPWGCHCPFLDCLPPASSVICILVLGALPMT